MASASAGWPALTPRAAETFADGFATVGAIQIPRSFSLHVFEPSPTDATEHPFDVVLMYGIAPSDNLAELRAVWSATHPIEEALDTLRTERPLAQWRGMAIMLLAANEAQEVGADVPEAIRQASRAPQTRRRDRITPDLLREVAEVYRGAQAAGRPTTQAVAEHFTKAEGTAAKWVWRARRGGFIDPVTGNENSHG